MSERTAASVRAEEPFISSGESLGGRFALSPSCANQTRDDAWKRRFTTERSFVKRVSLTRSNVDNNNEGYKEREDRRAERDKEEKRAGQGRAELTMSVKRNRAERSSVEQSEAK